MPRRSIAEHAGEVVSQHQVPCRDCSGRSADGVRRCGTCRGTGRLGNCPDCRGVGFFNTAGAWGGPATDPWRSCYSCGGKGWRGNCVACRGQGILESDSSYVVCAGCRGHGHLHEAFYTDDRPRGAVIVRVGDDGRFSVPLGELPVAFGRFPPPYASVRLFGTAIGKRHFDISWDPIAMTHEVIDHGIQSLRLNEEFLAGTERRFSLNGEVRIQSDSRLLVDGDALSIGQYLIHYTSSLGQAR